MQWSYFVDEENCSQPHSDENWIPSWQAPWGSTRILTRLVQDSETEGPRTPGLQDSRALGLGRIDQCKDWEKNKQSLYRKCRLSCDWGTLRRPKSLLRAQSAQLTAPLALRDNTYRSAVQKGKWGLQRESDLPTRTVRGVREAIRKVTMTNTMWNDGGDIGDGAGDNSDDEGGGLAMKTWSQQGWSRWRQCH